MTIENVIVTLNRVPEIRAIVDSGTDWTVVFGFVLTAVAVLAGAWVSISTFRKTANSQMVLAKAVALKESRQAWINELRDTCAEYIAAIGMIQVYSNGAQGHGAFVGAVREHDLPAAAALKESWEVEKRKLLLTAYSLSAKIQLLSNPNEADFKQLNIEVEEAFKLASSSGVASFDRCDRIIKLTQKILKTEWSRVKEMR